MKLCIPASLLLFACGQATHAPSGSPDATAGAPSSVGSNAGAPAPELAPMNEALPTCEEASLSVAGSHSTENWSQDRLLFPTSWQTFRAYAMRGPIDAITGIWGTGVVSAPFVDREVRPLTSLLVAAGGELLCGSGESRAVRNGAYAGVQVANLGRLTCSGEMVPGQLRYCHDCHQGDGAITGELDGDPVLELTGSRARVGDTLFLQMGWGVLIAHFDGNADGETLRDGAYLSFSNRVYCFESASGDASDIGTADITFTGFRHADPCQTGVGYGNAQACSKQFSVSRDW
jgi:hypothetical protein